MDIFLISLYHLAQESDSKLFAFTGCVTVHGSPRAPCGKHFRSGPIGDVRGGSAFHMAPVGQRVNCNPGACHQSYSSRVGHNVAPQKDLPSGLSKFTVTVQEGTFASRKTFYTPIRSALSERPLDVQRPPRLKRRPDRWRRFARKDNSPLRTCFSLRKEPVLNSYNLRANSNAP